MTPAEIAEWRMLVVYLIGLCFGFAFWLAIGFCLFRRS